MRRQSGFTLIELVIVIIVLAILSALAVPRFISLQREARIAVIDSLFNSVRSGANIVYAKSAAIGQSDQASGAVDPDGPSGPAASIATAFGYPEATESALSGLFDDLSPRYSFNASGTTLNMNIDGITTCAVSYAAPTAAGGTPTITRNITGC